MCGPLLASPGLCSPTLGSTPAILSGTHQFQFLFPQQEPTQPGHPACSLLRPRKTPDRRAGLSCCLTVSPV